MWLGRGAALQRKTAIFQLMPSVKFESNGRSSYDHECSYCDAISFNDARLHELAPILINRTSAKYYIDWDQLAVKSKAPPQGRRFRWMAM
jgi:hypothetical protein